MAKNQVAREGFVRSLKLSPPPTPSILLYPTGFPTEKKLSGDLLKSAL